jgi:uncharacterized membrane protein YbjE (DUF340 family)
VALDLLLYVAFAGGLAAGQVIHRRSPWVGRAATLTVAVLVFLLGAGLGGLTLSDLLGAIPLALVFAVATLGLTVGLAVLLTRRQPALRPSEVQSRTNFRTPLGFVGALLLGLAVGRLVGPGLGGLTEYALYVLLALIGFELTIEPGTLRSAWVPIVASIAGGFAVALVFVGFALVPSGAAFATAAAFGWYSLAGPLVGTRLGPSLGLFAFLANFLRENLTMLSAPWVGPRVRAEGLAAMGGATSMDTTLYFVTRYGDPRAGTVALATGIVLTTLAGVLVPLLLAIL